MKAPRPYSLPPILALAVLALLVGLWAGLLRLGWPLPMITPSLSLSHGPLMVAGFVGSLVVLERAVALGRMWMYLPPVLTAVGALLGALTPALGFGPLVLTLGTFGGLLILIEITRREPALHTVAMLLGAAAWFAGSLLWLVGRPIFQVVFFWQAFLVLTIAGERLELSRVLRPARPQQIIFGGIVVLLLGGATWSLFDLQAGTRLHGAALLLLALWSPRNDIAWRNLKHKLPLTRYIAWCLALGFVWLGIGGAIELIYGAQAAGPRYDAALHAVFVGFVISMIFGHAPIILPALLGAPIGFRPAFYAALILLHASLAMRVTADALSLISLRMWGGLLNEAAILWSLGMMAYSVRRSLAGRKRASSN